MDRRMLALALAAGLIAAVAHAQDPPQGFVELFKASTAAHEAKDYVAMERRLREALALRPSHPRALYNLATALALRGEAVGALQTLEALTRMGLVFDPWNDKAFAGLRNRDRFADVAREFERNRETVGEATVVARLRDSDFIPEGIAFDKDSGAFFVGGAHKRGIARIPRSGEPSAFIGGSSTLWAPLGMAAESSRRLLWVATAAIPEMKGADADEIGRSAVLAYDLESGNLKRRYPMEEIGHLFGDLLVHKGKVYVTDSKAGMLYALDTPSGNYEALTAPGALASPQGLALTRNRKGLYVADYTQGLFRYDFDTRHLERLEVGRDICVYGIDGLYADDDDLVAIQNGIRPHRVVRFSLDRGGRRVEHAYVLAANLPDFDQPTLGVMVNGRLNFVANSQRHRFDKDGKLPPNVQLKQPVVLRIKVDVPARRDERDRRDDRRREPYGQPAQPPPASPLPLPVCPLGNC
jgi:sugar lactone lactonase YvrE